MSWFSRKSKPAKNAEVTSPQQDKGITLYTSRLQTERGEVNLCITMRYEGESRTRWYYLSVDGIGRGECYTDTNYNDSKVRVVYGVALLFEQAIAAGANPEPSTFRCCWQAQYAGTLPDVAPKDDRMLTAYNILVEHFGQKTVDEAYELPIRRLPMQIRQAHKCDTE